MKRTLHSWEEAPPPPRTPSKEESDAFVEPIEFVSDLTVGECLDSCVGHIHYVTSVIAANNDWDKRTHKALAHLERAKLLLDIAIERWKKL